MHVMLLVFGLSLPVLFCRFALVCPLCIRSISLFVTTPASPASLAFPCLFPWSFLCHLSSHCVHCSFWFVFSFVFLFSFRPWTFICLPSVVWILDCVYQLIMKARLLLHLPGSLCVRTIVANQNIAF